jgi:hypothetical protein
MNRRLLLVVLLVVSTAAFVVGVSVERSSGDSHDEPAATAESGEAADSGEEPADEGAEGEASETGDKAHSEGAAGEADQDEDESVLGMDLEATPFVVLARRSRSGSPWRPGCARSRRRCSGPSRPRWSPSPRWTCARSSTRSTRTTAAWPCWPGVVAALHLAAAAIALSMGRSPALAPRDSLA